MTHPADVGRGRDIVARWCNLAEQRLEHLTELFETGRWRRYHTEQALLENLQEARAAVEIWRGLEMREASLDNSAIDLSWLGRPRSTLPPSVSRPVPARRLQSPPAQVPAKPLPSDVLGVVVAALKAALDGPVEASSGPDAPQLDDLPPVSLNIEVMQERYPLLRNAL